MDLRLELPEKPVQLADAVTQVEGLSSERWLWVRPARTEQTCRLLATLRDVLFPTLPGHPVRPPERQGGTEVPTHRDRVP